MAAIIFAQKQFTHYCERIQELLGFEQIPQTHRRDDLHLCPLSAVAGTTSSNLVFTKSAPPCTYLGSPIWGEGGGRGGFKGLASLWEGGRGGRGRPPIMLPPVPFVHAEDDPGAGGGQKTVKHSSFSSFGSSIQPSISEGSFWMKAVNFGNYGSSSMPLFDFARIMISSPL